ncbi:enoyl-CoA hydratase/isomerase family protein [bacterium]|nr:enoyl-CoA hydratase/isomerase family protein [bacterium]
MSFKFLKIEEQQYENAHPSVTLTLDRPKMNALNRKLLGELDEFLNSLEKKKLSSLIITGAGRAFVAGADIKAMSEMCKSEAAGFSRLGQSVFKQLEELDCVTIAAVNGFALGGGCELALACDLRIASDKALFGQPEVNLGLIPGFGGCVRLTRTVGISRAKRMILLGENIDAETAFEYGLVDEIVDGEELLILARDWAKTIAKGGPAAVAAAKKAIQSAAWGDDEDAYEAEVHGFSLLFDEKESKEGMGAFVEKRKPKFV